MAKHNLNDYREAKALGPHLDAILRVLVLTQRSLMLFKSYLPVIRILKVIDEQKVLLELHKKRYDEILKNKGKINN